MHQEMVAGNYLANGPSGDFWRCHTSLLLQPHMKPPDSHTTFVPFSPCIPVTPCFLYAYWGLCPNSIQGASYLATEIYVIDAARPHRTMRVTIL